MCLMNKTLAFAGGYINRVGSFRYGHMLWTPPAKLFAGASLPPIEVGLSHRVALEVNLMLKAAGKAAPEIVAASRAVEASFRQWGRELAAQGLPAERPGQLLQCAGFPEGPRPGTRGPRPLGNYPVGITVAVDGKRTESRIDRHCSLLF